MTDVRSLRKLRDIAREAQICRGIAEHGFAAFMASGEQGVLRRRAAERSIEIIAEASKGVAPEVRDQYPEVPWRNIIVMRNFFIHDYGRIDHGLVWDVIAVEIPKVAEVLGLPEPLDPYAF